MYVNGQASFPQSSTRAMSGLSPSCFRCSWPLSTVISMMKRNPMKSPPHFSTSFLAAAAVPPRQRESHRLAFGPRGGRGVWFEEKRKDDGD